MMSSKTFPLAAVTSSATRCSPSTRTSTFATSTFSKATCILPSRFTTPASATQSIAAHTPSKASLQHEAAERPLLEAPRSSRRTISRSFSGEPVLASRGKALSSRRFTCLSPRGSLTPNASSSATSLGGASQPPSQPLTSSLGSQTSSFNCQQQASMSPVAAAALTAETALHEEVREKERQQIRQSEWNLGGSRDPYYFRDGTEKQHRHQNPGGRSMSALDANPMTQEAWELLQASTVYYCNQPVGTVAASDPTDNSPLNYDQVFIRDFIPSAVAFMLSGQSEIVRNFLLYTLQLQSWEKTVDCHRPGEGLMPASFKVTQIPVEGGEYGEYEEHLDPDFGESAIGRVAPVDSGLWWIQLLRAYGRSTGDYSLQQRVDVQTGIKLILKICLADHFDMFPTLITTDGSCMIDRRMGIHGHPLEIQSLLYGALRAAKEMVLPENGGAELIRAVDGRLTALSFHVRQYYWLDQKKLNEIYRYKTEEYSHDAVNKFNIYPEQIPTWLMDWIPDRGGYFLGNVQPAHMDFRFFNLGNMWAIVSALASPQQAEAVLDLVEEKWDDLVGAMPMKIVHPALEGEEWRIITGSDPKNTAWSYHNGGSWPVLLWQFTAACIKMGRPHLAQRAVEVAEKKLQADRWPEYYDTKNGRFIGKQARLHQTWSIAGFLSAKLLLANPEAVWLFASEEDYKIVQARSSFFCTSEGNIKKRRSQPTRPPTCVAPLASRES